MTAHLLLIAIPLAAVWLAVAAYVASERVEGDNE